MDEPAPTREAIRGTGRSPLSEPVHLGPVPSAPGSSREVSKRLVVRRGAPEVQLGSIVVGAILALLILTAPLAIASPPPPTALSVQFGAPYTGATPFAAYSAVGCGSFGPTIAVPPSASASNGSVQATAVMSAKGSDFGYGGCAASNPGSVTMTEGLYGPAFTARSSGNLSITYKWSVMWTVNFTCRCFTYFLSHSIGPLAGGTTDITLIGNLYDRTTGTWALGNSGLGGKVASVHSQDASGDHHDSKNVTIRFVTALTQGDQYLFYTAMNTSFTVYATGLCFHFYHGCFWKYGSATVEVNVGAGGNRAEILSMKAA
jgi:hypothetical protein